LLSPFRPFSPTLTSAHIVAQENNRISRLEEALALGREEQLKDLSELENRSKMFTLRMPVSRQKYVPRHRVMFADVRYRDPTAARLHKLLSIFLFGVNVRYKNGIVNGLLATMVPPQTIPDPSNSVTAYYIDIEHRKLDFSNLYNYYGVAAALYNPSVMPSYVLLTSSLILLISHSLP
jgi:hypothetical protein